ncbi:CapA family protein [Flammeovirga aprica]|uniref:CapA family protein n=1 Tax=Flammeovirga aprica JL-4 TaxID=694437 RepID=A0A7X9RYG1_9BACT|nr:CapA family protein [Flammeovirga aprica]NME71087.1 CapA family protein [Flammeovirga aprica JL-4]
MLNKLTFLLLISCLFSCQKKDDKLKIVLTGDVLLDRGVAYRMRIHGDSLLVNAFKPFKGQDFTVINLEGTITATGPKQNDRYNFKSDEKCAGLLKEAGVTHVSIANNHIYDFGKEGYDNTINAIKKHQFQVVGHENKPSILEKGGKRCAILSASLLEHNEFLAISSVEELKQSVQKFVAQHENIPLIVYLHWGYEMQAVPLQWQRELAMQLIDLGVDAIVGHHPHVTQTIEYIKDKPVIYSLGNFVADPYMTDARSSYVVELEIDQEIEAVKLTPVAIKNCFPKTMALNDQMTALKRHLRFSNVSLYHDDQYWKLMQTKNINFSEPTDIWMISEKNTISMLKKFSEKSYLLKLQKGEVMTNVLQLHGSLSEYHIADINNDDHLDVLIGITKKVKFDSTLKKRVNIYTYKDKALKPLWLGTKLVNDVESFGVLKKNEKNYLTTVETLNENEKVERIYEWDDFGFALTELN